MSKKDLLRPTDSSKSRVPAFGHALNRDGDEPEGLPVTVVLTTVRATLFALERAGQLAAQLGARIRILAPQVVPFPLALDCPDVESSFKFRHFRTLCDSGAIETEIDVCLCRDAVQGVVQSLCPGTIVLLGGRTRWWRRREMRLAKAIEAAGHDVIYVPRS